MFTSPLDYPASQFSFFVGCFSGRTMNRPSCNKHHLVHCCNSKNAMPNYKIWKCGKMNQFMLKMKLSPITTTKPKANGNLWVWYTYTTFIKSLETHCAFLAGADIASVLNTQQFQVSLSTLQGHAHYPKYRLLQTNV